jgi:hypothetical protein
VPLPGRQKSQSPFAIGRALGRGMPCRPTTPDRVPVIGTMPRNVARFRGAPGVELEGSGSGSGRSPRLVGVREPDQLGVDARIGRWPSVLRLVELAEPTTTSRADAAAATGSRDNLLDPRGVARSGGWSTGHARTRAGCPDDDCCRPRQRSHADREPHWLTTRRHARRSCCIGWTSRCPRRSSRIQSVTRSAHGEGPYIAVGDRWWVGPPRSPRRRRRVRVDVTGRGRRRLASGSPTGWT